MATTAALKIVAEIMADAGLDPQCLIDTDETPGPFVLEGWTARVDQTIVLLPAAVDQAVSFTDAVGLLLVSDEPFDLRLAAGETLLTNLRAFVLWADSVTDHAHSTSVLLSGKGLATASIQALIIEET